MAKKRFRLPKLRSLSEAASIAREQIEATRFAKQSAPEDDVMLTYRPTNTTYPGNGWSHPRTSAAGYNRSTRTLRVQFYSNGAQYDYYDVPPSVARAFHQTASPGKFINSTLNGYDYTRVI